MYFAATGSLCQSTAFFPQTHTWHTEKDFENIAVGSVVGRLPLQLVLAQGFINRKPLRKIRNGF
jgi:hypothetical protein